MTGDREEAEPKPTEPRNDHGQSASKTAEKNPAGPHAAPDLTDEARTPGSGMFPEPDQATESPSG